MSNDFSFGFSNEMLTSYQNFGASDTKNTSLTTALSTICSYGYCVNIVQPKNN